MTLLRGSGGVWYTPHDGNTHGGDATSVGKTPLTIKITTLRNTMMLYHLNVYCKYSTKNKAELKEKAK